jgi:hypothetical protein
VVSHDSSFFDEKFETCVQFLVGNIFLGLVLVILTYEIEKHTVLVLDFES